jgi:outer membrane protein assembly factor BamA
MKRLSLIFLFFLLFTITFSSNAQEFSINDLQIRGAKKTKTAFIKKIIATKKGATLDSLALKEDIIILKRLASVGHAYFQVFHSHENYYNVFIHIQENLTVIPEINFWTTTNKRVAYKIGLYDYNFLGRNIAFGGFYQNNGFDSYAINFRAPNIISKKWGLSLNHQNWKSEEPLYFADKSANYLYNNVSFEVLGLHQINFKNQINFGINVFNEKYQYLSGATAVNIPQKLNLNKALFKFVYQYNNLDYYFQYIDGVKSVLYTQYVTSNNSFQEDFYIAWNDFFYYKRVGEKGNWANRLRVGLSSNQESPFAPFALDNNVNLRGVGILVDRGTGSIVLNSEYRYTLYDKEWLIIQGNGFVDAGSWRNPGGSLSDFTNSDNIKIYSGLGLRFTSKKIYNATFRIDYGIGLTKGSSQGLVFGIGQYF